MTDLFRPVGLYVAEPPLAAATTEDGIAALQSPALRLFLRERIDQVDRHGYTSEHDLAHDGAEIGQGALAYLCAGLAIELGDRFDPADARAAAHLDGAAAVWPWQRELFRPNDYLACLIKSAAMLVAEADRVILTRGMLEQLG